MAIYCRTSPSRATTTFRSRTLKSNPIELATLRRQVEDMGLRRFETLIGLGGKEYRQILRQSFAPKPVDFPFAGLSPFAALQATNRACR